MAAVRIVFLKQISFFVRQNWFSKKHKVQVLVHALYTVGDKKNTPNFCRHNF